MLTLADEPFVVACYQLLLPIVGVLLFVALDRRSKWLRFTVLAAVCAGSAAVQVVAFERGVQAKGAVFAAFAITIAVALGLSVAGVKLAGRWRSPPVWQALAGIGLGVLTMIPSPTMVLALACLFAGDCI